MWYKVKIETSPKQKGLPQTAVFYVKALGVKVAEDLALQAARTSKWALALSKNDVPFFKVQSIVADRAVGDITVGLADEPFWRVVYVFETSDGEKVKAAYLVQHHDLYAVLESYNIKTGPYLPEISAITKTKIEGVVYA